jgi:hypothetical protein
MISSINNYRPDKFDKSILLELKPYFDLDFTKSTDQDCQKWFKNLYAVAKSDVGIAHCINQHQSSRNALNIISRLNFQYQERLGCFSVHHDIDTIAVKNGTVSGIKNWITSAHQADYLVCKVGHHSDPDRCLLFIDFSKTKYQIDNNDFDPIGLKIAKPMKLILESQTLPEHWILHCGAFQAQDSQNSLLSFLKYGFLTNFLGCAVGLFQSLKDLVIKRQYHLDYELKLIESRLTLLKKSWEDNFGLSKLDILDQSYWNWHDAQYNQTKRCLVDMIKLIIDIGNSKFYDSNSQFSQRFRDALVWTSHGKSPYEQVQLSQFTGID